MHAALDDRRSPLEHFIDLLQSDRTTLPGLTPEGVNTLRTEVRAALPYIPDIVLAGGWADWTDGPTVRAIDAVINAEPRTEDDCEYYREQLACYVTGLLVGLALAHALTGSRGDL